jgi:hypothetical protein
VEIAVALAGKPGRLDELHRLLRFARDSVATMRRGCLRPQNGGVSHRVAALV